MKSQRNEAIEYMGHTICLRDKHANQHTLAVACLPDGVSLARKQRVIVLVVFPLHSGNLHKRILVRVIARSACYHNSVGKAQQNRPVHTHNLAHILREEFIEPLLVILPPWISIGEALWLGTFLIHSQLIIEVEAAPGE